MQEFGDETGGGKDLCAGINGSTQQRRAGGIDEADLGEIEARLGPLGLVARELRE
jgi:hypothetical protein